MIKSGDYAHFNGYRNNPSLWKDSYDYTYVLRSGEAQKRTATVTVEEREWRPRWFKWTKLFAHTRRTIEVEFDDEVGEDTGSWKGGAMGCGYDMKEIVTIDQQTGNRVKRFETPEECLRRMEAERKF